MDFRDQPTASPEKVVNSSTDKKGLIFIGTVHCSTVRAQVHKKIHGAGSQRCDNMSYRCVSPPARHGCLWCVCSRRGIIFHDTNKKKTRAEFFGPEENTLVAQACHVPHGTKCTCAILKLKMCPYFVLVLVGTIPRDFVPVRGHIYP